MDAIVARHGPVSRDIDLLYVSRKRFADGRLVAEAYLDAVLAKAGAVVVHPETLDLAAQMTLYRRAKRMVFSEGSALHALQLLGRLDADVSVLVRRPGARMVEEALRPRVKELAYWNVTTHLLQGVAPSGRPQVNRALALIDVPRLIAHFRRIGLDLAPHWDEQAFRKRVDADIRHWVSFMRARNAHPETPAAVRRCLEIARPDIAFDEVWQTTSRAA